MKKTGDLGEQLAAVYLTGKGYSIKERNWRGANGMKAPEVDIIATRSEVLVFIEVKTSTTNKYGSPQEWITPQKRSRLIQAAQIYLAAYDLANTACRFDAIVIDKSVKPPEILHIENAFSVTD